MLWNMLCFVVRLSCLEHQQKNAKRLFWVPFTTVENWKPDISVTHRTVEMYHQLCTRTFCTPKCVSRLDNPEFHDQTITWTDDGCNSFVMVFTFSSQLCSLQIFWQLVTNVCFFCNSETTVAIFCVLASVFLSVLDTDGSGWCLPLLAAVACQIYTLHF